MEQSRFHPQASSCCLLAVAAEAAAAAAAAVVMIYMAMMIATMTISLLLVGQHSNRRESLPCLNLMFPHLHLV